jgi:nigerose phosphorylase
MIESQPISRESPWHFSVDAFHAEDIALNGNRFMLGNGYLGYRGTLEEFGGEQLVGCMLNGVYDQAPGKWREPVNAPNGWFVRIEGLGGILYHEQVLDMRQASMSRRTVYASASGPVTVTTRRFVSQDDVHLLCLEYSIRADAVCQLTVHTGIDTDVWDINGPHLGESEFEHRDGILGVVTKTRELGIRVAVCEAIDCEAETVTREGARAIALDLEPGTVRTFRKYVSVFTSLDGEGDPAESARESCERAKETGYEALLARHSTCWDAIWDRCDVRIDGDDEAQFALRYSLYHLQLAAPRHSGRVSIPARGLSGQVYKGAVFWDTEMFMTPVFSMTEPQVARNLILYRYHTLDGARRKAAEYGFRGAFYAWESQETGDDACTHFNVTDVFTGRPMRTYFRDKQIHISADIAYAIRQYLSQTGDRSILSDGAAEIVAECARFLHSYACYKPNRDRFELHDVTGPDEYHERVNNNAFTNRMAKFALDTALELLAILKLESQESHDELESRIHFEAELEEWRKMSAGLHVPGPDPATGIIPQFDGYGRMEDVSLSELKGRVLDPNEYLGGGNGLASQTKILKQADVILMLNLFPDDHPEETVRANWEYYEPRTEHGSSLSACAYAMVAARTGNPDWAYDYFMKTATVDLTGNSKQFVGPLYIGGTHPAANGGAWMSAVFGFAGLRADEGGISLHPRLPSHWKGMEFHAEWRGTRHLIKITRDHASVEPCENQHP